MSLKPIEIYQEHKDLFDRYQSLLLKWNQKINLTAITDPEEMIEKHFVDSLSLVPLLLRWLSLSENVSRETFSPSLLDIGSGAGLPGLPLKIAFPNLRLTLVDAVKKKCDFLKEVIRSLSLKEAEVRHETLRGQSIGVFDVVVSRATFSLKEYLSLAVPQLKPQGIVVAMKGPEVESEVHEAREALRSFHLKPFESVSFELPHSKSQRRILMTRFS